MKTSKKSQSRQRRIKSIKKKLKNITNYPRITVFRSNKHIYTQIINDLEHKTLTGASDLELSLKKNQKPLEVAKEVGKLIGKKASDLKITKVIFDRRGYKYHGRVKELADGIRESGLIF